MPTPERPAAPSLHNRSARLNVSALGECRLPIRRLPSKLCATLDISRRLRMDVESRSEFNKPIVRDARHARRDGCPEWLSGSHPLAWRSGDAARRDTSQQPVLPHFRGIDRAGHRRSAGGLRRRLCARGARPASGLRRRAGVGRSDPRRPHAGGARPDAARCGGARPWVSAHPDVILKMGVKEVLHRTRHLGWGTDTHLYRDRRRLSRRVPGHVSRRGPRVSSRTAATAVRACGRSKRLRAAGAASLVPVLHARRGSVPEDIAAR